MSRLFLVPTLLAAGFGKANANAVKVTGLGSAPPDTGSGTLFQIFKQQHAVTLAEHRSHSSHASHSSHQSGSGGGGHYSHTSHQSSYGGSGDYSAPLYTPPAPAYTSPAPTYTPASPAPQSATSEGALRSLGGRTKKFATIVRRVQIGLLAQGVYAGPIDGVVSPATRAALRRFQSDHGLDSSGTITPQTLDALKVPSD